MADIKTIKLGDILIDEDLFTKLLGLTDYVMSWPSVKKHDGGTDLTGDLIWFLIRPLKLEKNTTPEGHSGWVLTIDWPQPEVGS